MGRGKQSECLWEQQGTALSRFFFLNHYLTEKLWLVLKDQACLSKLGLPGPTCVLVGGGREHSGSDIIMVATSQGTL